jgi:hypothetical protein
LRLPLLLSRDTYEASGRERAWDCPSAGSPASGQLGVRFSFAHMSALIGTSPGQPGPHPGDLPPITNRMWAVYLLC